MSNIKVRMVSGVKRERRKEIVSLPPEKTRSTATAEPKTPEHFYGTKYEEIVPGIVIMSRASRYKRGNSVFLAYHH